MAPKARPRTREPRVTHQPFGIDKLPEEVHEAIRILRSKAGLTWARIEARSAKPYSAKWEKDGGGFVDWENLDLTLLEIFPNLRIPASNLHRWFYASVLQARNEVMEDGDAAQKFVEKLGDLQIPGMNDAVMNQMARTVFDMISGVSAGNKAQMVGALSEASLVLSRLQRVQIQQKKVEGEARKIVLLEAREKLAMQKLEAETERLAKKIQSGQPITADDLAEARKKTFGF